MRLFDEQLENIKKQYNVDRLYSWSKVNTFMTSKYEYLLKYVKHEKEDRNDSAYMPLGSLSHTIIENLYENKIKLDEMPDLFEESWVTAIDISDLKFDRSNEDKNKSISEKYYANLKHFFANHNPIKEKIYIEKFLVAKIGNHVLQGYVDALIYDEENKEFTIIDWKTSSIFSGKSLAEHSGQLVCYLIALTQKQIPQEKIKIGFNFLKYVTVQYEQKNGEVKTRNVERFEIGEKLKSNAKTWLKAFNYDVDYYLDLLVTTNSIECLPDEIKAKYKISDCYVYVPVTDKLVEDWKKTISDTIEDIEYREKDYYETDSDKCFWDNEESLKAQSYYFNNLCSYSINKLLPYKEYLAKKNNEIDTTFCGVGSDIRDTPNIQSTKVNNLDLSWLEEI